MWRGVLRLVIAALLLWALTTVKARLAEWRFVQSPAVGEIAYLATFDGGLDDWSLYDGQLSASVKDGALTLAMDSLQQYAFSTAKQYWGDFDLSVQATPLTGPENNGYGLIFRLRDQGNTSFADDDFYAFLVSSDGYYQVMRSVKGQQKELSTWIPSPAIQLGLGVTNHLRVQVKGNTFQFYINGTPAQMCIPNNPEGKSTYTTECVDGKMLDRLTDYALTDGRVGVLAQTFDEAGVSVSFDNLLVTGATG